MSYQELEIRVQWGDMTLELKGDAAVVLGELKALKQFGIGRIADFFALRNLPSSAGAPGLPTSGQSSPVVSPEPDPAIVTNPQPEEGSTPPVEPSVGEPVIATAPEPHGDFFHFAIDQFILPQSAAQAMSFASDVDHDSFHRSDNLIGSVLSAVLSASVFGPIPLGGVRPHLLRLQTIDPVLRTDEAASVRFLRGQSVPGTATQVIVDADAPDPLLFGTLIDGSFTGRADLRPASPISLDLPLAMADPASFVPLEVHAGRLDFDVDPTGIANGKITGGVDFADFKAMFFPALADQVNHFIEKDPSSEAAKRLTTFFHLEDKTSPLTAADVDAHPILTALLAPDVEVDGKSLLSIGIGFTAKPTTF